MASAQGSGSASSGLTLTRQPQDSQDGDTELDEHMTDEYGGDWQRVKPTLNKKVP